MQRYLVESAHHEIEHRGRTSRGVRAEPLPRCQRRSETIYLHVLALDDKELGQLEVRIDDDGNKEHDRIALPQQHFIGVCEWWIACEGEHGWPRTASMGGGPRSPSAGRPLVSTCVFGADGIPRPAALDDGALTRLRGLGADLP